MNKYLKIEIRRGVDRLKKTAQMVYDNPQDVRANQELQVRKKIFFNLKKI
jgi:hypothetical protein